MTNSTIIIKEGVCLDCDDEKYKPLIAGRCQRHYSIYRKLLSQQRIAKREADKKGITLEEKDLADLINDCDILYSRWLRLSNADERGNCKCYTCGRIISWKMTDCGHFVSRKETFLRYDTRNTKPQCTKCNRLMDGNLCEYAKKLNIENPGVVEILLEESNIVYKWSRDELRQLISEYSQKVNDLMINFKNKT